MITDADQDQWSITASGQVTVNGVVDQTTSQVISIAYESGMIWQENSAGLWWSKSDASDQWGPLDGTATSPIPKAGIQVQSFDLPTYSIEGVPQTLEALK